MAEEQRGFAGFELFVTDLSDLPSPSPQPAAQDRPAAAPAIKPENLGLPRSPRKKGSFPKWVALAVILGGGGIIWVANNSSDFQAVPQGNPTTPKTGAPTAPYTRPQPTVEPQEKPPVAQDMVLSTAQLRYCLSQSARIDGAEKAINRTSQAEINRFNALVSDYNPRCGKFRYYPSAMQAAKAEVEARRTQLENEGAALVRSLYSR